MSEQAIVVWSGNVPDVTRQAVETTMVQLEQSAPESYNMSEFKARVALAFAQDPKLGKCKPESIAKALLDVVNLGLVLGKEAQLIPFGDTCTMIEEFQAWQRLLLEYPTVKRVNHNVVKENDSFKHNPNSHKVKHRIDWMQPRGKLKLVYCEVIFKDGQRLTEVLDASDIERHKRRAQGGGKSGPWVTDEERMWLKSAIQSWGAKFGRGLPGLGHLIDASEHAVEVEYQKTGPDSEAVDEAITNLFGDREDRVLVANDSYPGRQEAIEENLDALQSEKANELSGMQDQTDRMRLRGDGGEIARLMDQCRLSDRAKAAMIKTASGSDSTLAEIEDVEVLRKLEGMLKGRLEDKSQLTLQQEESSA